jgi:hypothetical protein
MCGDVQRFSTEILYSFTPGITGKVTATTCGQGYDYSDSVLVQVGGDECQCVASNDHASRRTFCSTLEVDGVAGETLYFAVSLRGDSESSALTFWTEGCTNDYCTSLLDNVAEMTLVPDAPLLYGTFSKSVYYAPPSPNCAGVSMRNRMVLYNLQSEETGKYTVNVCGATHDSQNTVSVALVDGDRACSCVDADNADYMRPAFNVESTGAPLFESGEGEGEGYYFYSNRRCSSIDVDLVAGEGKLIGVSPEYRFDRLPASYTIEVVKDGELVFDSCKNLDRFVHDVLRCNDELSGTIDAADEIVVPACGDDTEASAGQALFLYRTYGDETTTFTVCPTDDSTLVPALSVRNDFCTCVDVVAGTVDETTGCSSFTTTMEGAAVVIVSGADGSSGSFSITMDSDVCDAPCPYTAETVAEMPTITCATAHRGRLDDTTETETYGCDGRTENNPAVPILFVAPEDGDYLITTCTGGRVYDTVLVVSSDQCMCIGYNDDRSSMSHHLGLEEYMYSPADRKILEDAGYGIGEGYGDRGWGYREAWGYGQGYGESSFHTYCSALEMRLEAGGRVVSRVSEFSRGFNDETFTLRVVGPVCDSLCENEECDDFSFLNREFFSDDDVGDDDDDRSSGPGTAAIVVITLLCAAVVGLCIWQYTRSREPVMVNLVEATDSETAAPPRRRRRGESETDEADELST